ncbi:hypothetical protein F5J12DRAFT_915340 [Pisolithus orientalis]|uniref:uncharacterized protein n=1 Tax=Pisolithus orientalis TaxID=936130 RepID=UPI002224C84B|nr:uncharacterized protein F5J12DRAFT_915340 [Pisolithus orientalis]KAI5993830.1 hypothetical protein F5J12DRAFT_915340 [Pisolithus orientalis]
MPAWTDEFIRKSLLAEDIIDVHFHLFSYRSKARVLLPRTLNSNTALLKSTGTKYFDDLFSSAAIPSPALMINVKTTDSIFDGLELDDYGYESDSDLEDEDDGTSVKSDTGDILASRAHTPVATGSDYEETVSYPYLPDTSSSADDYTFPVKQNGLGTTSAMSSWGSQNMPSLSDHGCHIFVKDTAFQTWYSLMYYLYTDNIAFSPLKSSGPQGPQKFSRTAKSKPQCSAKSMYSLATKLGIDELRDQAFASIRSNVDENNLLQELASSFTGRYPAVLELELDLLAEEIASAPIVEGLPHLMRRIAQKELSHGADILIGYNARILRKHYLPARSTPALPRSPSSLEGVPIQLKASNSVTTSEWIREELVERNISDKEEQPCPSSSSTHPTTSWLSSYGSAAPTKNADGSIPKRMKKKY